MLGIYIVTRLVFFLFGFPFALMVSIVLCFYFGAPSDAYHIPLGTLMVIFGVFWWWFVGQFMRGGVEDDPAPNVVAGSTQSNTGSQQPRQAEAVPVPLWHADVKAALRDAGYEAVQIDQALDHLPADADELTALKMALQQLGKR